MLAPLLASLFSAAMATATPSPKPAPPPLKVIVNVRASASCAEIVTHANAAITTALRGDNTLQQAISTLRNVNLDDGNPFHRRAGLRSLSDLASTLLKGSLAGNREVKRLRDIAYRSKDPAQHKQLKAFADELGGALYRQKKIAMDLNGFVTRIETYDSMNSDQDSPWGDPNSDEFTRPGLLGNDPKMYHGIGTQQPSATYGARLAANDFQSRVSGITNDEGSAATSLLGGATSGC